MRCIDERLAYTISYDRCFGSHWPRHFAVKVQYEADPPPANSSFKYIYTSSSVWWEEEYVLVSPFVIGPVQFQTGLWITFEIVIRPKSFQISSTSLLQKVGEEVKENALLRCTKSKWRWPPRLIQCKWEHFMMSPPIDVLKQVRRVLQRFVEQQQSQDESVLTAIMVSPNMP